MTKILSISSEVLSGAVGNTVARPALTAMGHEIFTLPTVILAVHPGHGPTEPVVTAPEDMENLLQGLQDLGRLEDLAAIVTGYFASAEQVQLAAAWIKKLKSADPALLYICDPILGDKGALYVKEEIANAIRDQLVPRADVLVPNRFELEWLTGKPCTSKEDIITAARILAPATVLCSSAIETESNLTSILVTPDETFDKTTERFPSVPHGTGDLLTALFVGHLAAKENHRDAFRAAVREVFKVCERSEGAADLLLN
ncbi:MAG: pyridoxal kinase [Alphaproteobacteria bacterium]|nr:MAG: pyridoxal kinase [Alphaproteobacteria bacterium]